MAIMWLINKIPGTTWGSPRRFLGAAREFARAKDSLDAATLFGKLKEFSKPTWPGRLCQFASRLGSPSWHPSVCWCNSTRASARGWLTERVVGPWGGLPRKVVMAPSLPEFKEQPDNTLSRMV